MMDYISIQGYKSIKDAKIELAPINILIGANGSGKSNFISFFEFLNRLQEKKLQEYVALQGGEDKMLFNGRKITPSISFKMEFDQGTNGYAVHLRAGANGFVIVDENLIFQGDEKRINWGSPETKITETDNYRATYVIKYLTGLRKYHFHDTGIHSPFSKLSHVENDIYYLYGDGSNLAALLFNLKKNQKIVYRRIVKTIQSIAPYFSDFYFSPNAEKYLRLQWKDKYSDIIYGVNDLSDGTLRFIALCALFLQSSLPDTIIIDEPELGLHPAAISKLAGMIQSVSSRACQVIMATQSTELISHFQPEDIVTVDQVHGASVFNRLNSENLKHWLNEYTLDDLWKRNIITRGQPSYDI